MKDSQINTAYDDLFSKMTSQMSDLENRLRAQKEEEKLRKIKEQMDLERKRKEEEERRKKEEEEERKRFLFIAFFDLSKPLCQWGSQEGRCWQMQYSTLCRWFFLGNSKWKRS